MATADADWVNLDPASGEAATEAVAVKVTAEDNTAKEARIAKVTVKAGELTKTVTVTQAAAGEEPEPEKPVLQLSDWALVGSFGEGNNWNAESDLYLSILDEEYFVYYGCELAEDTEFKFLKGGAWPPAGQEVGGNGLVEPNTIQPAGGSNIKVTEAGTYDIYLAADLAKFYVMSEGKLPSEATEPAPVENQWGMMGCFVDNQWGSDVPMTKEGEWLVAKGAQFTELTFKIRANASWADATNIGVAPGSERGVVNGKISVVTAEYSKANLGGDAADIKLNGEAGTYDVYFSFENLEVYVMEQGFKPGEKEPQTPEPVEVTYTVVGTIAENAWVNNAAVGLMAADGDYLVAKNVPFVWNSTCYGGDYNRIEFKIVETGTWDGYAYPEKNIDQYANAEITVSAGGENIAVDAPEGNYDVYFDKANLKVWVMEAGAKPGEKEPLLPAPSYNIISSTEVTEWGVDAFAALFTQYGTDEVTEDFICEDLYFFAGGGKFKFGENNNAAGEKVARFQFGGSGKYAENKQIVKFFVPGPGTLKVEAISSGDSERPLMVAINGTPTVETGYNLPAKTETPIVVEVDCSTATNGSEIALWSGNSGINVFSVKWIPAGVTETEPTPEPEGVKVLFEGPFDASWDNAMNALSYDGYDWSTATVGDIIKIYGHPTDASASWYGMNFRTGEGWVAFTEAPDQFNTPTTVAIKINQKTYDELVAKKGFVLVGTGYTVDKVELIPAALEATSFEDLLNGAGTFESQNVSMIGCWGDNAPSVALSASEEGYDGGYALVLKNPVDGGQYNGWKAQAALDLPNALDPTKTYVMSFYVKASTNASVGVQYQNASYSNQGGNMSFTALTNWVYVEHEFTTGSFDDITRLIFNFGETKADFYIDNFKFGPKK